MRGAFDVEDIGAAPTPFSPAGDGHPLAPIAGPIVVRGAEAGDVGAIELIELTPFGSGKSAILRDFGGATTRLPGPHGARVIIGELRVGTSPRPVLAARPIVPEEQLRAAGWSGDLP